MKKPFEKTIRNGLVAVLISNGFGAGWSTWANDEESAFLLFDSNLVALAERKAPEDEVRLYLKGVFGKDKIPYTSGWSDISIQWRPIGSAFAISENDGAESIVCEGDPYWHIA